MAITYMVVCHCCRTQQSFFPPLPLKRRGFQKGTCVKQCCGIADFQEYWEKAREVTMHEDAPPKMFLTRMATTGKLLPIRVQHMLVSVSSKIYPAVSALLPIDEAARAVYASFS